MSGSSSPDYGKGGISFLFSFILFSAAYFYLDWRTKSEPFGTRGYHLIYDLLVLVILLGAGVVFGIIGAIFTKEGIERKL